MSLCAVQSLERVSRVLEGFTDGRKPSEEAIESLLLQLELVYREFLVKHTLVTISRWRSTYSYSYSRQDFESQATFGNGLGTTCHIGPTLFNLAHRARRLYLSYQEYLKAVSSVLFCI